MIDLYYWPTPDTPALSLTEEERSILYGQKQFERH
jgi:hypothetical protein